MLASLGAPVFCCGFFQLGDGGLSCLLGDFLLDEASNLTIVNGHELEVKLWMKRLIQLLDTGAERVI